MRVDLGGACVHARVLNEALICHASPAATSRYLLRIARRGRGAREEDQRSSGVWIGPAAGSTAAQRSAGGEVLPLASRKLQYVVREPYTPAGGRFRFAKGLVGERDRLVIRSKMREAKLFLDGRIVLPVTIGDVLVMRRSDESLTVLGIARKRRE
jgi:NAD+ kinase